MRQPSHDDMVRAVDMGRAFMQHEGHDAKTVAIAGYFIAEFLVVAYTKEWPVFHSSFPDMMRAVAIMLDDVHRSVKD